MSLKAIPQQEFQNVSNSGSSSGLLKESTSKMNPLSKYTGMLAISFQELHGHTLHVCTCVNSTHMQYPHFLLQFQPYLVFKFTPCKSCTYSTKQLVDQPWD